jgi:hypothetical protein
MEQTITKWTVPYIILKYNALASAVYRQMQ